MNTARAYNQLKLKASPAGRLHEPDSSAYIHFDSDWSGFNPSHDMSFFQGLTEARNRTQPLNKSSANRLSPNRTVESSGGHMLPKAGLYLRTFFVIDQRVICITETHDLDTGRKIGLAPGKLPQPVVSGRCEDIHKAHGAVGHLWLQ
jgi:hypothetical protein